MQIKKETASRWEYNFGNKVNIANFASFVKTPIHWPNLSLTPALALLLSGRKSVSVNTIPHISIQAIKLPVSDSDCVSSVWTHH